MASLDGSRIISVAPSDSVRRSDDRFLWGFPLFAVGCEIFVSALNYLERIHGGSFFCDVAIFHLDCTDNGRNSVGRPRRFDKGKVQARRVAPARAFYRCFTVSVPRSVLSRLCIRLVAVPLHERTLRTSDRADVAGRTSLADRAFWLGRRGVRGYRERAFLDRVRRERRDSASGAGALASLEGQGRKR